MASSPPDALAYLNWGRWVADCPWPECTDARAVNPLEPPGGNHRAPPDQWVPSARDHLDQVCDNGHPLRILMPGNRKAIDEAVAERIEDADRYWYPHGHPRATELGMPMGRTPGQIREEGREHNARRAAERS